MSNYAWIAILVLILTLLGSGTLLFITVKYYWGVRGTPPPTRDERRKLRDEELRLREKQLEHSDRHRWKTRSDSFFDNTKRS
jgi:hypothetical protein